MNLQEKQKASLLKILSFNSNSMNQEIWGEQWKILIYDRFCRDVISPILKLHELRNQGVTLHLMLNSERQEIPDVRAVYLVQPTAENILKISNDCARSLYNSAYLNFVSPTSRDQLETLAKLTVESNSSGLISKVFDRYLNFVSLEPHLFTLNQLNSYSSYNDSAVPDTQIETTMDNIVEGLFSVLATLGAVPIIRCPNNNGPSTMIAQKLYSMLKDHLTGKSDVFAESLTGSSGFQRPVLIIMDRNEDLCSALHHPSTYQALVDDLLKIEMNRINIKKTMQDASSTEKLYDLDVNSDDFFARHAGDLFPDAIASNEEEMKHVLKNEEELRAKTTLTGNDDGAQNLVDAVDTLPALMEKKKMLEAHTNIFQAAFEIVASRQVPSFSMLEQKLIDNGSMDENEILELISDPEQGSVEDKIRLLIVFYLSTGISSTSTNIRTMEEALEKIIQSSQADNQANHTYLKAWHYIRTHPSFQRHASVGGTISSPRNSSMAIGNAAPSMTMFKGLAGNIAGHAQGWLQQAAASVKQFLPENKKLHVTRVTDAICELRPNTEDETYLYLDPKSSTTGENTPRHRSPFREAIVFMIGGGNYNEYSNLQAYAKAQQTHQRHILYGCTELLNPSALLEQMSKCHKA